MVLGGPDCSGLALWTCRSLLQHRKESVVATLADSDVVKLKRHRHHVKQDKWMATAVIDYCEQILGHFVES